MISNEDKERVRDATDFLQLVSETVVLKQRSIDDFWGCCPFHTEKSPSFHITPSTGLWHCFGCGEGGDIFDYIMKRENIEFGDAVRYLADRAGIELHETRSYDGNSVNKNRLSAVCSAAEEFFSTELLRVQGPGNDEARKYWSKRGFSSSICKKWNLGFAPGRGKLIDFLHNKGFYNREIEAADLGIYRDGTLQDRFFNRVMIPIKSEIGKTIAFGGRVLNDSKPKYLNSKDTMLFHKHKQLFAYDRAKDSILTSQIAIVCEGYTDAICMHEAGFTNTVAVLGTALSIDHIKLLSRLKPKQIISMFDGDEAGQRAAEKAVQYIADTTSQLMCVVLPDNLDPAEYLDKYGAEEMQRRLDEAIPLMSFVIDKKLSQVDLSNPGEKVQALKNISGVLAPLKRSILLDEYANKIADILGFPKEDVKREIKVAKVPVRMEDDNREIIVTNTSVNNKSNDSNLQYLDSETRSELSVERELLQMMTANVSFFMPLSDRISSIIWADNRNQTICWALMSQNKELTPKEAVDIATASEPNAPKILSSVPSNISEDDFEKHATFLLDTAELYSCKRKISKIKAQIASMEIGDESKALFDEATILQKRVKELHARLR